MGLPGAVLLLGVGLYVPELQEWIERIPSATFGQGLALLVAAVLAGGVLEAVTRVCWEPELIRLKSPTPDALSLLLTGGEHTLNPYERGGRSLTSGFSTTPNRTGEARQMKITWHGSSSTRPRGRLWAAVSAVIASTVVLVDLFTSSIGLVETVGKWIVPPPTPQVLVTPFETDGGTECLEFAFSDLPEDFEMGKVHLRVVEGRGPTPLSGNMSAEILHVLVNMEVSPAIVAGGPEPIVFRAAFTAEKENDNAIVDFCPILTTPGAGAEIRVVPSFLALNGTPIDAIEVSTHDQSPVEHGVSVRLSRATNVNVSLDETRTRLAPLEVRDVASGEILAATAEVDTSEDLSALLTNLPTASSETALWMDAIGMTVKSVGRTPNGRASIARLMEAAVVHAGVAPDQVALDRLSSEDIRAMQEIVGFPDGGDLLNYLLRRGPSLRDSFEFGDQYSVMRFVEDEWHYVHERLDGRPPYLGIDPEEGLNIAGWLVTPFRGVEDPVATASGERAKSRTLNLTTLPEIVLAAKAFRAAARVPERYRVYPLLVAVQSVNRAFALRPDDFRWLAYAAEVELANALRIYRDKDSYLRNEARRSGMRVPRAALVAGLFEVAAESFGALGVSDVDVFGEVSAAWGEAIARFAYGADAGSALGRVTERVGADSLEYAALLNWFVEYLPQEEAELLGDFGSWRARAREVLQAGASEIDQSAERSLEDEFTRLMGTVGRPDIVVPFVMDRIEGARGTDRELELLRRLGASMQGVYSLMSFRLESENGWVYRSTEGYDPLLDFVGGVEDMPYSSTTPEEDRVETMQAYGVAERAGARDLSEMETWIDGSMTRSSATGSIVPYMKIVWVDWFGLAFVEGGRPILEASEFRYEAMNASALVEIDRVRVLGEHSSATAHQKYLIDLLLRTRSFLEEVYP